MWGHVDLAFINFKLLNLCTNHLEGINFIKLNLMRARKAGIAAVLALILLYVSRHDRGVQDENVQVDARPRKDQWWVSLQQALVREVAAADKGKVGV